MCDFSNQDDVKVQTFPNPSYDDATLELAANKSSNQKSVTKVQEEF